MKVRHFLLVSILVVLMLNLIGCGGKDSDPVASEIVRSGEVFQPSIPIFDADTSGDDFIDDLQPNYHDIDLGQVCIIGTGWDAFSEHGCVAVTLNRPTFANGDDLFKPVMRWLDSTNGVPSAGCDPMWVAEQVDLDITGTDDGMYSSIAINNDMGLTQKWASITYLAQSNNTLNAWRPRAATIALNDMDTHGTNAWVDASTNVLAVGNYNLSDIPFQNPGISSAIMTNLDNFYWAAWANRIEMEPPPHFISAAYGFADL